MMSKYNIDFHHLSLLSENKFSHKQESIFSDNSVDAGEKERFFLFKKKKDDGKISLNCAHWWEDISDFLTFFSAFRVAQETTLACLSLFEEVKDLCQD